MAKTHGTWQDYRHGCRCARCRAAWAGYCRDKRRAAGRPSRAEVGVQRSLAEAERVIEAEPRSDVVVTVRLSPLAARLLAARQIALQQDRGEVVDQLLRETAQP